jgi:hypothetical protein
VTRRCDEIEAVLDLRVGEPPVLARDDRADPTACEEQLDVLAAVA